MGSIVCTIVVISRNNCQCIGFKQLWSKERIMEVYLNSIEMGKGVYGIKAVSNAHFNKAPKELRRRDCALIAATLPNPLKYSSKNPGPYMRKRQQKILREMRNIESSCGWTYQP